MPSKLVELEIKAAIRYLNMDYDEYLRLRNMALEIYRRMLLRDVARANRLKYREFIKLRQSWRVPVREILEWKRCERIS